MDNWSNYLFTTIGVRKERKERKSEIKVERREGFHLSPLKFTTSNYAMKKGCDLDYDNTIIHTERVGNDEEKSRAIASRYGYRQKLKRNSFTLELDNLIKETSNRTTSRFNIQPLKEDAEQERSKSKNRYLKARIKSAMKMVVEKYKTSCHKSLDFKIYKLGTKMTIYDRYEEGRRIKRHEIERMEEERERMREREKEMRDYKSEVKKKSKMRASDMMKRSYWADVKPWENNSDQLKR